MQRQGVPLVKPHAPLVGTGMEHQGALDSGTCTIARRAGIVDRRCFPHRDSTDVDLSSVDSIVLNNVDIYHLIKYRRSNQNTCITQRPLVKKGDYVKAGDIIVDGLPQKMVSWRWDRTFGSLSCHGMATTSRIPLLSHGACCTRMSTLLCISMFSIQLLVTRSQGEITRDIPNVSEEALRNLMRVDYLNRHLRSPRRHSSWQGHSKGRNPTQSRRKTASSNFGEGR